MGKWMIILLLRSNESELFRSVGVFRIDIAAVAGINGLNHGLFT